MDDVSEFAWKDLAGNAMHLGLLGYIFMYVISTVHDVPQDMKLNSFGSGVSQTGGSSMNDSALQQGSDRAGEHVAALEMETQSL